MKSEKSRLGTTKRHPRRADAAKETPVNSRIVETPMTHGGRKIAREYYGGARVMESLLQGALLGNGLDERGSKTVQVIQRNPRTIAQGFLADEGPFRDVSPS